MGYVEKFKKEEIAFGKILGTLGDVKMSTDEEDMKEHWDLKLEIRYDVKAMKKVRRSDAFPNENIHWVELKNVNGELGWLYGDANKFSFETEDYWIEVDKIKLQDFIKSKCKNKERCNSPELYKLYQREGRKDMITLVKTIDLIFISDKMHYKNKILETTEN